MDIGSAEWIDIILDGAGQMGLTVSRRQADQFARHAQLLMEWNRKINLTAITDPIQVAVKHYIDAIAPLKHIPAEGRLLDMGTGGGFPGVPLKIMMPGLPMTLIDSVRKKINFVKHVIRQLGLHPIEALHARAEELAGNISYSKGFQVVVCRAVSDMEIIVKWAAPLLAPGGRIIAYKGPQPADTASVKSRSTLIESGGRRFQSTTETYHLPLLNDPRTITIWESSG